ncbi:PA14 domain-containing protein [Draconibacterium sp.]|nr:PA14 domain-containing protein [Draconibacterium sp.]
MLKFKLGIILIACATLLSAQNSSTVFNSDVETNKKPWTNLDFQNDPNNFQFVIMSDRTGGNRPGIFKDAVEKINMMVPEFVMCVGDLIAGYTTDTAEIAKQWNEVNNIISGLDMPFFYLPGNHDITNKVMEKEWEKRYGRRYYNFIYKNTLFITLDSNDDDDYNLTQKQTDFVLNSLKENPDVRWTFIFMHHPIWTYDTGGRFESIQNALKNRKHTVIAGHVHRYHHAEHDGANYYTLATTGASSSLLGENFGRFDHITWMTMTDDGPVMANLKLDGILPHDITNDETLARANPMLANTQLNHILLCNKGEKFEHGTLYFSFKNPSEEDLKIELNFFHHHQLQIPGAETELVVDAGKEKIIEIAITSQKPIQYSEIDLLRFDWNMKYINSDQPKFAMQGKYQIFVEPGETSFISNGINVFTEKALVEVDQPFSVLETVFKLNNGDEMEYEKPVEIISDTEFSFFLKNSKNEVTKTESRSFTKSTPQKATKVRKPKAGLKCNYYEGDWTELPDFSKLTAKSEGVVNDFMVRDVAQREDNWALVYTGYIKVEDDDLYIFRTIADDACRFRINDKVVIDESTKIKGEFIGAVSLKKGYHPVRIEFLERKGNQRLRFYSKNNENADWDFMEFDGFYYK